MKKYLMLGLIMSSLIYANEYNEENYYSNLPPKIVSGEQAAKQNVGTNFVYDDNSVYSVYTKPNYLSIFIMGPGEVITSLQAGDTARWNAAESTIGTSTGDRAVVYVKPTAPNLRTNMMISTNKRFYNILLNSDMQKLNPKVEWRYPNEDFVKMVEAKKVADEKNEMTLSDPTKQNFKYAISTRKYDFAPQSIFDDGKKTFILFKNDLPRQPIFSVKENGKMVLVNYRVIGNYLIYDGLFKEARLTIGNQNINIKNKGV